MQGAKMKRAFAYRHLVRKVLPAAFCKEGEGEMLVALTIRAEKLGNGLKL
jgi:hypothetical protein